MPQFRRKPGQQRNPNAMRADMLNSVHRGIDVGEEHVSVRAQIKRLGRDEVRKAAEAVGRKPPSDRTLRRWAKNNRIPHPELRELVRRADQVQRAGGDEAAAQKWGRSVRTIRSWKSNPNHSLRDDAQDKVAETDLATRRSAAGIPNVNGRITKPATVTVSGDVWVKGTSSSPTYEAHRNVDKTLDLETTERVVEARERGDEAAALAAIEEFLSTNHAVCDGYGDEFGWHWENLDSFEIRW